MKAERIKDSHRTFAPLEQFARSLVYRTTCLAANVIWQSGPVIVIPIIAYGSDRLPRINLSLIIGNGGTAIGNRPSDPIITAIDLTARRVRPELPR